MNVLTPLCCSSIKLPFSTLLLSPGTGECSTGSYVCDINANCTKTDDSYICACKGYTGDGHSCQGIIIAFEIAGESFSQIKKKLFPLKLRNLMFFSLSCNVLAINFCSQMSMSVAMATMFAMLIRTVTTQMVLIFVLARKDTLEMDSHVKVNKSSLHYLKHAALHINYRPWKLARILEVCFHAPLSYFHWVTSFTSLMLLDIDECSNGSHDCDVNANCTNTNGSHSCTCKEGYTGKGESCQGKIRLD